MQRNNFQIQNYLLIIPLYEETVHMIKFIINIKSVETFTYW